MLDLDDLKLVNDRDGHAAGDALQRVPAASISAGHAELLPTDTLDSVIARADAELYLAKGRRRS